MPINEKVMLKHIDNVAAKIVQDEADYVTAHPDERRNWTCKFIYVDKRAWPFGMNLSGIKTPANLCIDADTGGETPYGVWDSFDDKKSGRKRYIEVAAYAIRGGLTFEYIKTLMLADHWQIHPDCPPSARLGLGEILDVRGYSHEALSDAPDGRGQPFYVYDDDGDIYCGYGCNCSNSPIADDHIPYIKRIAPSNAVAYIEEHPLGEAGYDAYWCTDMEAAKLLKKIDPNLQIVNLKTQKSL